MLRTRLVTGVALIAGLIGLVWLDARVPPLQLREGVAVPGTLLLAIAALIVAPLLAAELAQMARGAGIRASTPACACAAAAGCLSVALASWPRGGPQLAAWMSVAPLACMAMAGIAAMRGQRTDGIAASCGTALLAYALIGLALGCWVALRSATDAWTLAAAMLTVKASDIGAYFTGHAIGRHKLIPWLSPGKTWEGLVGGIALAAGTGAAVGAWAGLAAIDVRTGIALGLAAGVVGPAGDLLESALKRGAGMKDSGRGIPGMGGLYDVIDSLLLAGPVALLILVPASASATLPSP